MAFLYFILKGSKKAKGRMLGGIRQYWRQFKMLSAKHNGITIDGKVAWEVHKVKESEFWEFNRDAEEIRQYIMTVLKPLFNLDPGIKSKPISDVDSITLALVHHWAKDTSVFPTERQRVQLPAIWNLCGGTGARPGEFVDATAALRVDASKPGRDSGWRHPWDDAENPEFLAESNGHQDGERPKALCYEDVRIYIVRVKNTSQSRLGMEVKLGHHKGSEYRPKP
jgi:hypothetical protein